MCPPDRLSDRIMVEMPTRLMESGPLTLAAVRKRKSSRCFGAVRFPNEINEMNEFELLRFRVNITKKVEPLIAQKMTSNTKTIGKRSKRVCFFQLSETRLRVRNELFAVMDRRAICIEKWFAHLNIFPCYLLGSRRRALLYASHNIILYIILTCQIYPEW